MPTIFLSTKIATLIGSSRLSLIDNSSKLDPRTAWNAQLFTHERRKCIIVTNKATLYSFVRLNILKKDLSDLSHFFLSSLFKQLKADNLYNKEEENYWLEQYLNITFARTDNDKKVIGSINDFIIQLKLGLSYPAATNLEKPTDTSAATFVNTIPMGMLRYKTPLDIYKEMRKNA